MPDWGDFMGSGTLGILAFVHRSSHRPFGEQTGYIRSLLETAQHMGLDACAFGPEYVDLERNRVTAYVIQGGSWRKVRRRLPRLIYDRFFLHEPRPVVLRRYRRLLRSGIFRFLNPTLPDKWRLHCVLVRDKAVRCYLPPTRKYRDADQLVKLLRRWRSVVLKPAQGMKGRGLWFLRKDGDRLVVRKGTKGSICLREADLRQWAKSHTFNNFIVQRALQLQDKHGRPFDLRVLVQRDRHNNLQVTGAGVRMGRPGSLVSNLHQGGRALTIEAAFREIPEMAWGSAAGSVRTAAAFTDHLGAAALSIARSLDRRYGPLAEVGLDFGFDLQSKRLYFIEANSRPGRIIFRRMGDHATRSLSIRRPLEYACYRLLSVSDLSG